MRRWVERLLAWRLRGMARLKRRSWLLWAIVGSVSLIAVDILLAFVSDGAIKLLPWVWNGVAWFAARPMGLGGLMLVAFLLVLLGHSYLDTRPRKARSAPHSKPSLSQQDNKLIQDLRTPWNRFGVRAVDLLHSLFLKVVEDLKAKSYLAPLLDTHLRELETTRDALNKALDDKSVMSLADVRERFNNMYGAYLRACLWLARINEFDIKLSEEPYSERLKGWRIWHYCFRGRLLDLNQVPEHNGTLKIFTPFLERDYEARFLAQADAPSPAPPCDGLYS